MTKLRSHIGITDTHIFIILSKQRYLLWNNAIFPSNIFVPNCLRTAFPSFTTTSSDVPSSQSTIINFDIINCFGARFWLPFYPASNLYESKFGAQRFWLVIANGDKIVLGCWTLADHGHHRRLIHIDYHMAMFISPSRL